MACGRGPVAVHVVAYLDAARPLSRVEITALPYDAPGLLDSLSRAMPDPPPTFPGLEQEMRGFLPSDPGDLGSAGRAWKATRDSAQRLADSLRSLDRRAPGYGVAYARFRRLYHRLTERSGEREAAYRSVTAEDRSLAAQAGAAADSLRAWERLAYTDFDSLAAAALAASGRKVLRIRTDASGRADFVLEPGQWWLILRIPYRGNPFLEYVWEVPLVVRGHRPLRVPIFDNNVEIRWRH